MKKFSNLAAGTTLASLLLAGCGTAPVTDDMARLRAELDAEKTRAGDLASAKSSLESTLSGRDEQVKQLMDKLAMAEAAEPPLLPPKAKPGECYARVFIPPVYETVTKTVLHKDAGEMIQVSAPRYETVTERVLVKEASKKLEVVPARYDWVEERIMVKEASEKLEVVPAKYEQVEEKTLVREAYTTWKKGRGPIEKIDHMTGEIMCLVEVPAEYSTVVKHKLVAPATTRKVSLPAEYRTVRKRVMVEPPRTVEVDVPAVYQTVNVRKMAAPAGENRIATPAQYKTVSDRKLVKDGSLEWRPILCETNTTPDLVRKLQTALRNAGYSPGPVDGVLGANTLRAVTAYQNDNRLPSGKLTIETLRRLDVLSAS